MALQTALSITNRHLARRITPSVSNVGPPLSIFGSEDKIMSKKIHSTSFRPSPRASQSPQVEEIFQKIVQLDTIEVHLLTELVNEKLGFKKLTQAQREALSRGGPGGSSKKTAEAEEKEVKTAFDLKLTGFDVKAKIKVIKEIRAITGLGLKDAKEMVEGCPKVVKKEIKMEEAEEIKSKLEAVGGTVEIL